MAISSTLSGTASYTATSSHIWLRQDDAFRLPRHQVNLGLTWLHPSRWRLTFDPVWRSRQSYWSGSTSAYWESRDKRYSIALFAKDLVSRYDSTFYGAAASLRF
jgi:hypothetical protein